jgi:ABC-type sugar transport system ATPase subunit
MTGVRKSFDGTQALKGVNFSARLGEVHAIVGENGAGKSTLMKILAGALQPDSGEILIDGNPVMIENPFSAHNLGIRAVYQEFSLVRHLSVTENILLGQMPTRQTKWIVNWADSHRVASAKLEELGFSGLDVRARVSNLSVSHQQMAEIAKAAITQPRIWILDEPSAVLSNEELKRLFALIQKLKAESTLILYISHRLDEVFAIADRITVLKDGELVGTVEANRTDENQLVKMMVGRTLGEFYPERVNQPGEETLKVSNLSRAGHFSNISFSLKRGEILGFFGLVGSGRTQVARCIFGADKVSRGEILLNGHAIRIRSPKDAVKQGIAFVTEDRKRDGLVLSCSIRDNASMAIWPEVSRWGVLNSRDRDERVKTEVRELSVQPAEIRKLARQLSGGNQQKVVLAKWLLSQARVLILDEPTRGVDIATKVEIYHIISDLAEKGVGILLISSELPEILGMGDRILVMKSGSIVGEFLAEKATEENLLACAAGVVQ